VRRLAALLVLLPLLLPGCGSGGTTTITTTEPGPPTTTDTTDTGATETEPPPRDESGERIDVGDSYFLRTPSGRIGCAATTNPSTLRCDTAFPTRFSRSGRTCEFGDYGQAFVVRPHGAGKAICAGDTVLLSGNASHTIPYGRTWLLGPYTCISRKSGLTCENGEGHGVALSLQAQKVF
jgi:hypothetical protein